MNTALVIMHESKHCSRLHLGYTFDYSLPQAKCTMSLVEHYLARTFALANANKFYFHGHTLGLSPNKLSGSLLPSMIPPLTMKLKIT